MRYYRTNSLTGDVEVSDCNCEQALHYKSKAIELASIVDKINMNEIKGMVHYGDAKLLAIEILKREDLSQ